MFWHALGSYEVLQERIQCLMSLYFWINLLSVSVPLLVSFHPKIGLYKKFPSLFVAIFLSMVPYISWDVYFTQSGYWGFTPTYLSGIYLLDLPIEEWLFFVCIPFACVFTHYSILAINPKLKLSKAVVQKITWVLVIIFLLVGTFNFSKAYTLVDMSFGLVILLMVYRYDGELLSSFFITFLFMVIPFFIVNGVLTGSGIPDQVVWYNDKENLGIRMFTIPVEDTVYAFSLILLNLFVFRKAS